MSNRPYFRYSIYEIQETFDNAHDNNTILNDLKFELEHRTTPKAKKLLKEIDRILNEGTVPMQPMQPMQPMPKNFTIECPDCNASNNIFIIGEEKQYFSCANCQLAFDAQIKNGVLQTHFSKRESNIASIPSLPTSSSTTQDIAQPEQVLVECSNCHTPNFVLNKIERVQYLSCSNCKQPFEAEFKYGVLRTNFITQKSEEKTQSNSYIIMGIIIASIVILVLVFK
mgnify:CR=1 FL=1